MQQPQALPTRILSTNGKRTLDIISFPSWSRFFQEQSMFAVTISSLSNGSLTMIWHLDPINLLKLSLSDKFLVTLVIVLTSDTSFIIVLLYFVLFFFLLYTYLLSPAHPSCLLTFPSITRTTG